MKRLISSLMRFYYLLTYWFRRAKIDVIKAQLSGDQSFIDVRYHLTRPDKVKARNQVYLIDESTGKRLYLMALPRLGEIKTRHRKYQHTGVFIFRNTGNIVRTGSSISLFFDKFQVQHIGVE